MKKQYIAAFACILAVACSKAELNEVNPGPKGETITVTIPQTKVAVSGKSYWFELGDEIVAIASNGSKATLTPNATSSEASTATDYFTGTFDKPVVDGSTISFYYNAKTIADNGTATFEQNGNPWLVSTNNAFTRTSDRQISVTATLTAPENVRAIAVITDGSGIESFEFHAKDQNIKLGTFDGTSFSGDASVSQKVIYHQSDDIEHKCSNIVYVPKDMEGGFWIKAVKGQQVMYKSYATKNPIENTKVTIDKFVPAEVKIDVQISGFPTSYSYYVANEGIEGITAPDVNKANGVSNDWMGEGKATFTISREGIPAALLTFESFKLTVDGKEYTGDEATKVISVEAGNGHTTWGQKDIVATVIYKDLDGNKYTGTKTVTRHITGLPYAANPPKNSGDNAWTSQNKCSFESNYVLFGEWGTAAGGSCSISFSCPTDIEVNVSSKIDAHSALVSTTSYVDVSSIRILECTPSKAYSTETLESNKDSKLLFSNPKLTVGTTYGAGKTSGKLYYINLIYR